MERKHTTISPKLTTEAGAARFANIKIVLFSLVGVAMVFLMTYQCLGQVIDIGNATDFSKSLAVAPSGTLTMTLEFGDVQITGVDQNTARIRILCNVNRANESDAAKILRREHVVIKQTGNTISINSCEPSSVHHFFGWNESDLNVRYEITVPRQFGVHVETAGGNVKLDGLRGDISAKTDGGQLKFQDIDGNVDGETAGGDVYAHNCHSSVNLKTMGGNITIEEFAGMEIHATTEGGSVSADFLAAPKADSRFDTSGGNVTVRLPNKAAIMLDARAEGGSVKTELAVQVDGELRDNNLKGTINGGGPLLKLETEGGNIEVLTR
jgi:DUF4097 and DUF4098 domain-containing protein YvlB